MYKKVELNQPNKNWSAIANQNKKDVVNYKDYKQTSTKIINYSKAKAK